jgi:Ulp1 family protease
MEFVCIPVNLNNQHWIAVLIDKSKGLVLLFDPYGERHDWVLQVMLCWLREECSTRNVCLDIEWRTVTVPVPQHSFLHRARCGLASR